LPVHQLAGASSLPLPKAFFCLFFLISVWGILYDAGAYQDEASQ
jgi:hypothetical protein